ncbi:hypothetical protein MRB53_035939 [Persea americana]|uniref:Uncharacterized protein n=1 Tax=Persea americana TaxID=3435 RepID=A0ACC2K6F1_PERAE|nr:hypothetical protein MRB53_035939 [Persea americana]
MTPKTDSNDKRATIAEWKSLKPDSHTSNVVVGIKATISRSQLDKKICKDESSSLIAHENEVEKVAEKIRSILSKRFILLKPMMALPFKDRTMWHIHLIIFTSKCEIEQLRFWCQYWILLAVLTVSDKVGYRCTVKPNWHSLFICGILKQREQHVYDAFLRPYVAKHETEIDCNLLELRARAGNIVTKSITIFFSPAYSASFFFSPALILCLNRNSVNMDDVGLTFEKSEELLSPMLNVIQDNFK